MDYFNSIIMVMEIQQ